MKLTIHKQCQLVAVRVFALIALGAAAFPVSPVRAATEGARVVKYAKEDIVPVRAKLRFSTLIVLPDDEEILDFTTRNSGSSTVRTISAMSTRPRPASAAT
jgi:type IV secretory pathway VirB9-like protein